MEALVNSSPQECKERVYWRRAGEVMHYMADYFTFPHNKNFTGNLYEHNKYEKHLKNYLKRYINGERAAQPTIIPVYFGSFQELVAYIKKAHEGYLLKERNIVEDIHEHILRICSQVIHGILQLAAVRAGAETRIFCFRLRADRIEVILSRQVPGIHRICSAEDRS